MVRTWSPSHHLKILVDPGILDGSDKIILIGAGSLVEAIDQLQKSPPDDQHIGDLGEMMILIASSVAQAVDAHGSRLHSRLARRYDCVLAEKAVWGCVDVGRRWEDRPGDD